MCVGDVPQTHVQHGVPSPQLCVQRCEGTCARSPSSSAALRLSPGPAGPQPLSASSWWDAAGLGPCGGEDGLRRGAQGSSSAGGLFPHPTKCILNLGGVCGRKGSGARRSRSSHATRREVSPTLCPHWRGPGEPGLTAASWLGERLPPAAGSSASSCSFLVHAREMRWPRRLGLVPGPSQGPDSEGPLASPPPPAPQGLRAWEVRAGRCQGAHPAPRAGRGICRLWAPVGRGAAPQGHLPARPLPPCTQRGPGGSSKSLPDEGAFLGCVKPRAVWEHR